MSRETDQAPVLKIESCNDQPEPRPFKEEFLYWRNVLLAEQDPRARVDIVKMRELVNKRHMAKMQKTAELSVGLKQNPFN